MSQYKFTLNPYGGCAFGCEYCYARFFAPSAEQRQTWGRWVLVKRNARQLIARACGAAALKSGDAVYMSSVTDPYQPVERRLGMTRAVLQTILDSGIQPRLTIQTRSPLVTRDIDLFRCFERIRIHFTITTDSEDVRRRYEPRCFPIKARIEAAAALVSAGIRIGVSISPMLPMKDPGSFGAQLAKLNAEEYVTQYLKPTRSQFAAGSSAEAWRMMREDGWSQREYRQAREEIAQRLGEQQPLLEGREGYAPA